MKNENINHQPTTSLSSKTFVIGITKEQTFEYFFRKYYSVLCFFAQSIIHNEEEAKDIVQDCFVKLWEDNNITAKVDNIKSFLYAMVRNRCIDYTRKQEVRKKAAIHLRQSKKAEVFFDELAFAEMVCLTLKHVEQLPLRSKIIMKKYFFQSKRHKKIADELSSSENAIQIQKNRVIKLLRKKLLKNGIQYK